MVCAKYKQWSGTNITVGIVDYIHYGKVRKVAFSSATSWSSFVIFFLFFLKDVHIYLLLLIIFMYSQFSILFGCKLYKLLPPPASIDFIGIWLFILLKVCYFVYPMNTSGQFKNTRILYFKKIWHNAISYPCKQFHKYSYTSWAWIPIDSLHCDCT